MAQKKVPNRDSLKLLLVAVFALFNGALWAQAPFELSGELRTRVQGRDNADFNSERLDGTVFVLQRTRLGVSRQLESSIGIFVQFQDSRIWGEEGSSLAALGKTDLHQAFVEIDSIAGRAISVKLGRQKLTFGSQRLVGSYDWDNVGRAFDAATIRIGHAQQNLNLWMAQVRDFNAPAIGRNQEFGGAYFSSQKLLPGTSDAYALFFFDERNYDSLTDLEVPIERSETGSNHLTLWTFGGRWQWRPAKSLTFELEGAYQCGNRGPLDIRASAFAIESAYHFVGKARPSIMAGYTFGSGDSDRGDFEIGTFTNLFPDAHRHLGAMDYASWSNIAALHVGMQLQPAGHFEIGGKIHFLALADDNDAFYRAEGYRIGSPAEIFRSAVPGAGTDVGREIDFFAKLHYRKSVTIHAGLSYFAVGEFLENTGGLRADNSYFGYLSIAAAF